MQGNIITIQNAWLYRPVDHTDKRNLKYESMKITPGHSISHSSGWRFCQTIISPDRPAIVLSPHRTYVTGSHTVVLLKWLSMKAWQTRLRIICMVVTIQGDMTWRMCTLSKR